MIDLMAATGGTADRPEPIRPARLLGGQAVTQEQGPGMREVLQQISNAYQAAEELPMSRGVAADTAPVLHEQPGDTGDELLRSSLSEVAGARDQRLPAEAYLDADVGEGPMPGTRLPHQPTESADAAWPVTGNLPLEQIEQWLDEQRHLQAQHGSLQPPEVAAEQPLRAPDSWAQDARRLIAQPGMHPAAAAQIAARSDSTVATADSRTALSPAANTLQFDVLAQAVRSDETALQTPAGRLGETAAVTALSPLVQSAGSAATAAVPVEIRLQGPEARWGEQMLQALRDQVEMQVSQRSQQATIRLDPPELGSLNIQISHEQGKLNVHINAAQADVARLLGMLSERLRHELIGQNFTEVSVGVGSDAGQGGQERRQASHTAGESVAAAGEAGQQRAGSSQGPSSDILISV